MLHHEVVDYWQLFELMTYCHTSIAPLEETNFNACKSNVKFLERQRGRLSARRLADP